MKNAICNFSEIAPLKKVLMHRPGDEFLNLTPNTLERLLFDDIPYLKIAKEEHDALLKAWRIEKVGVLEYYRRRHVDSILHNLLDKAPTSVLHDFSATDVAPPDSYRLIIGETELFNTLKKVLMTETSAHKGRIASMVKGEHSPVSEILSCLPAAYLFQSDQILCLMPEEEIRF